MKTSVSVITTSLVLAAFVGLFLGTTSTAVPLVVAAPAKSPLQTSSHVTIQNTTISGPDPLPGHQGHQAAIILPPRTDGKLWVGTVTWTSSKPVELVVLHGYINVTADSAHGVPIASGTAPFVGSAVAFHTLSGAKFTVTYSVDAVANTKTK